MSIELLMVSRDGALHPATPSDAETLMMAPPRRYLSVEISRTAPSKLKAWYRVLLDRIVDATGAWPSPQQAHRQLLIRCGFMESVVINDWGDFRVTPPSTKDWDDFDWRRYIDVLFPILVNEILPEIGEAKLKRGIEVLLGLSMDEAMEGT